MENNSQYIDSLEIQSRLAHAENYNNWLFSHVERYVNNRILEVGCALGNFTKKIIGKEFICAIDVEDDYLKIIKGLFGDAANLKIAKHDISSPAVLELEKYKFDTIICFNVLEHIKEDDKAINNMSRLLSKGGHLCLIVPAFQALFGEMDRTDNHYRRYSKGMLIKKMIAAGFSVKECKYMNMPGFFGWWFNAKILKRKYIPFRQMLGYDKIIPAVRLIESVFTPPFGQSLVMIAEKQK